MAFALAVTLPYALAATAFTPVPEEIQAILFRRILSLNTVLAQFRDYRVLVVETPSDGGRSREIVRALSAVGITAVAVRPEDLDAQVSQSTVIYVPLTGPTDRMKQLCASRQALSISGIAEHAENGDVSIALGMKDDGRAEIIINTKRLQLERHDFLPDLMRLARKVE